MSEFIVPDGLTAVKRVAPTRLPVADRAEVRRQSCATLRQQAEDLALVPRPLRADVWSWLAAVALEATDRAENGCSICGALIERPDGGCRRAAS